MLRSAAAGVTCLYDAVAPFLASLSDNFDSNSHLTYQQNAQVFRLTWTNLALRYSATASAARKGVRLTFAVTLVPDGRFVFHYFSVVDPMNYNGSRPVSAECSRFR